MYIQVLDWISNTHQYFMIVINVFTDRCYFNIFQDLAEGNTAAAERMEMLINICTTTLSAMVNIPLSVDEGADGRRKVI